MAENLGDLLRKKEQEHDNWLQQIAERKKEDALAQSQKEMEAAAQWLAELRIKIPIDIENGRGWHEKYRGMIYVIPEGPKVLFQVRYNRKERGQLYYFHDESLWATFVQWAKEVGLDASIQNQSHSEQHGEEGWSEHDFYYVLLKPLK